MPALRYSEDTEFNDALRARGILPPLEKDEVDDYEEPTKQENDKSLEDRIKSSNDQRSIDEIDLEEDLPAGLVDSWKTQRLDQLREIENVLNSKGSNSGLRPIGKEDFVREVNEASKLEIDHPGSLPGTGVIICLWNNSPASSHFLSLLNTLSRSYPTVKFLSIPGASCIQNYPDQHQPTIICYRNGNCLAQFVGLGKVDGSNPSCFRGLSTKLEELEKELLSLKVLDPLLRARKNVSFMKNDDEEEEEEEEEGEERFKTRKNQHRSIRKSNVDDDDFELDL